MKTLNLAIGQEPSPFSLQPLRKIISKVKSLLVEFFNSLLSFIYLSDCSICHARLKNDKHLVCNNCHGKLKRFSGHANCRNNEHLSKVTVALEFESVFQNIIHLLKYNNNRSVAGFLGGILVDTISSHPDCQNADMLVPVPLHKVKLRERGYNQSQLLCEAISEKTGIPLEGAVQRKQYTKTQTKLKAEQRKENVKNAFAVCRPDTVKGKRIILVDDVITTGSTMNATAKALLDAGAKEVLALALAMPCL